MRPSLPPIRVALPTVAAALAIEFLLGQLRPPDDGYGLQGWAGLLVVAIEVLAFALPPLLVIRLTQADWRYTLRWQAAPLPVLMPVLLAAPALSVLLLYVQAYWGRYWSQLLPTSGGPALSDVLQADTSLQVAGLILLVGVVPAVSEELFFRGFLMRVLGQRWRPALVIGLTTALFALLHFDFYGLPTYIVLGIWFGVLALRSGSLFAPVLAHLLHNGLDVVGRNLLSAETFEIHAGWLPLVGLAGTMAAVALLAWLTDKAPTPPALPETPSQPPLPETPSQPPPVQGEES